MERSNGKNVWVDVSPDRPCAECKKSDWCSRTDDGSAWICRRQLGGTEKTDGSGATYWLYRATTDIRHREPLFSQLNERADADTLDKVYSALLESLPLHFCHLNNLITRGLGKGPLPLPELKQVGYRSLGKERVSACNKLIDNGLEPLLPNVPGFYVQKKNGQRYWSVGGRGGLLVPIRDITGRITALLIRTDDGKPKYTYLSSKKKGGAGPRAPAHVPVHDAATAFEIVRITEGALKADIATKLSGMLTIGLSSVATWGRAAPGLRQLRANIARLAYDADATINPHVAGHLASLYHHLIGQDFIVELERWPLSDGKGIDDLLAAGKQPEVILGDAVASAVAGFVAAARGQSFDIASGRTSANARQANQGREETMGEFQRPHYLAREFVLTQQHPHRPRIMRFRGQFWKWCTTRWEAISDDEIKCKLSAHCKNVIDRIYASLSPPQEGKDPEPAPKITTGVVANVMLALGGIESVPDSTPFPSWIGPGDGGRKYIAMDNGLLDVSALMRAEPLEKCLLPHLPWWFSPIVFRYGFAPEADYPKWRAFLNRNLEGEQSPKATLLQQWFGYCLLPDVSLQKFLILLGEGANGKSVICAVLRAVLGEDNCTSVPLEMFGERFALERTLGKLANIVAEVGELDRVAEGVLKEFTGGDFMQFEQKFKAPFAARPTARLLLSTNNLPDFRDKTDGLWRRVLPIRFTVQIPEGERVKGMDLPEWWAEERPGILNWALAGLHQLSQNTRFTIPRECQAEIDRLRGEANPARRFLEGYYCRGPGEMAKAAVYEHYARWCDENGHRPLASNKLATEVFRLFSGVEAGKSSFGGKRVPVFTGLQAC
jgi:P4 family phage/plasmid primase-like protien